MIFTINENDILQKLYDFGDTLVLVCLHKEKQYLL